MSDKIGEAFVEFGTDLNKMKSGLKEAENLAKDTGKKIETTSKNTKLDFNDQLANMKLKQLKQLHTALTQQMQKKIELGANDASINKTLSAIDSVKAKMNELTTKQPKIELDGAGELVKEVAGIAIAAFTVEKAFGLVEKSVEKFEAREKALLGVESVIRSMGKESEFSAQKLQDLDLGLLKVNKYSIKMDDVLDMQGFLMTLDTMNDKLLPEASQLVIDLAAKMKTDLTSAAKSLGIALEDPEGGLNRFRRSGIIFTEAQKDIIKSMVESGNKAGAQAKIFEVLEAKVGGYAKNTTTALESFRNRMSTVFANMERVVGGFIAKALTPALKSVENLFPDSAVSQAESLNKSVKSLESSISPLLKRYDELKGKTNLTTTEHNELKSVMGKIAEAVPGAISAWDAYGNAISVSTEKVWGFIAAEKERLKYVNKNAIQETYNDYAKVNDEMRILEGNIQKGTHTVFQGGSRFTPAKSVEMPYSQDELIDLEKQLAELGEKKRGIEEQYKKLSGENLKENKVAPTTKTHLTDKELKEQEASIKAYYDAVKWHDANYNTFLDGELNKRAEEFRKAGLKEIQIAEWKNEELKKRQLDYNEWQVNEGWEKRIEKAAKEGLGGVQAKGQETPNVNTTMLPQEALGEAKSQMEADFKGLLNDIESAQKASESFAKTLTDAFASSIFQGKNLGDVFKGLLLDLGELILKATLFKGISSAFGVASGGGVLGVAGKAIGSFLGDIFGAKVSMPTSSISIPSAIAPSPMLASVRSNGSNRDVIQALSTLNTSVQAMNITLVKKEFKANVNVGLDTKGLTRAIKTTEKSLIKSGERFND